MFGAVLGLLKCLRGDARKRRDFDYGCNSFAFLAAAFFFFFFFEFWKEVEVEPSPSSSVEKNQMALPQQCRIFSRPRKVVCEP